MIIIALISFVVPFVFALCGLGSAIALIPILVFLGVPFPYARSAGLFVNAVTTISVTLRNVQSGEFEPKIALPIVLSSVIFSPIGAYASLSIPNKVVGLTFTLFLFSVAFTTIFPMKKFRENEKLPIAVLIGIGALAGFVSGLLGVGGGGVILPLLITFGLNPRIAITVTPLSVPFSSITSFITYAKLGGVDWNVVLCSAIPASIAGYTAGIVQKRLRTKTIRKILAVVLMVVAVRFALKFI